MQWTNLADNESFVVRFWYDNKWNTYKSYEVEMPAHTAAIDLNQVFQFVEIYAYNNQNVTDIIMYRKGKPL